MGGAKEFLVSVSIALTADLPFSMFVPSFISGSLHSWSLNLCICGRWVKVLVSIPGWLLFSLALAWTRLIRAFNGTSRNFTEPGVGSYYLITYLSHLRRGTLSQCCSPAGEAFKKKKNHDILMVGRWGDPGLVQKCVLLHVTNLSHFLWCFHEFCKKWLHLLINLFIFKNKPRIIWYFCCENLYNLLKIEVIFY